MCMCSLCARVSALLPTPFPVHVNPHLFSKGQRGGGEGGPSNGLFCIADPHDVPSFPLLLHSCPCFHITNYHTSSLITRAIYYWRISKMRRTRSFLFFFSFVSPFPFISPPISASYSPRFPSLSLHSLVSGWKVQWGCGIPEGQGGGLPLTRAQYVCKAGASYRPICQQWLVTACRLCRVPREGWKVQSSHV